MPVTINQIMDEAIAARAFPGAVIWLQRGEWTAHQAFGGKRYNGEPVTLDTVYDIASLTKLFTATAFLIASERVGVDIETPLQKYFSDFSVNDKSEITLRHLLHHNSGIELGIQRFCEEDCATWMSRIAAAPLHAAPGIKVLYSCSNFFLLARVVEKIAGMSLQNFVSEEILSPLKMRATHFGKPGDNSIAPTEWDETTQKYFQGEVHDEAARGWERQTGNICGNAGIFSTAADLAKFARMWNQSGAFGGKQIVPEQLARLALCDTVLDDNNKRRGWGWQEGATFYQSTLAPPGTAGHAGFTGPTMFIHPKHETVCIVLNNRVHPTRNGPDRMPYHRSIAEQMWSAAA